MAAGLPCRLVAQLAFKARCDAFLHLVAKRPHHLADATPQKIQACHLHQGEYGTDGAVIEWKYTLDGKEQSAKQVLQNVNLEKKHIAYKMIEGDLLELYKNMVITIHFETKDGVDLIAWTVDYELINPENPHPLSLIGFFIDFTKEVETHISG